MKSKQIAQITPYLLDGYLIISLNEDWIKVFNGIPRFDVLIDEDEKLNLRSSRSIKMIKDPLTKKYEEIII